MGGPTDGRTDKSNLHNFSCSECNYLISLGAYAKLQKATACFILPACLSVCRSSRPLPLDGFSRNLIFEYFSKKITSILHDHLRTSMTIYCLIHLKMRNISHKCCGENQNIYFLFSNKFFFSKIVACMRCEQKYCIAEQATDDSMTHAHCMLDNWGYKHTLRICNTFRFSKITMVARTFLNVTLYVHCLSLLININQLDVLNFIISLFQASTCFEHMCSSSGGQNCIIQSLVLSHL